MRKIKNVIVVSLFLSCMMPLSVQALDDLAKGFLMGACATIAVQTAIIATPIVMYFRESGQTLDYKPKSLDIKVLQEPESVLKEQNRKNIEELVEKSRECEVQKLHDLVILSS